MPRFTRYTSRTCETSRPKVGRRRLGSPAHERLLVLLTSEQPARTTVRLELVFGWSASLGFESHGPDAPVVLARRVLLACAAHSVLAADRVTPDQLLLEVIG